MRIVIIWSLIIGTILSCTNNINYKLEGTRGFSKSSKESLERKVFLANCFSSLKEINIDQKLNYRINASIFEKAFRYGKSASETNIDSNGFSEGNYQLNIYFDKYLEKNYTKDFLLQLEINNKMFRALENILSCPIDSIYLNDTLNIKIYKCDNFKIFDTIGVFKIFKSLD
jgi:hypothetical protein